MQNRVAYCLTRPEADAGSRDWPIERLHDEDQPDPAFQKAHDLLQGESVPAGIGVDSDLRRYAIAWYDNADGKTTLNLVAAPFGTSPLPEPVRHEVASSAGILAGSMRPALHVQWSPDGERIVISSPTILIEGADVPLPMAQIYDVETRSVQAFPETAVPRFRSASMPLVGGEAFAAFGGDVSSSDCGAFRPDGQGFLAVRRNPESKQFEAAFMLANGDVRSLEFAGVEGEDEKSRRLAESLPEDAVLDALALRFTTERLETEAGGNAFALAQMMWPVGEISWEGSVATVTRRSLMAEQGHDYALRIDTETGRVVALVATRLERRYLEGNTYTASWEYVFPDTGVMLVSARHANGYQRLLVVRPDGTTERLGEFDRWTASIVYPAPNGKAAVVYAGRQAEGGGILNPAPIRYDAMLALTVLDDGSFRPIGAGDNSD